MENENNLSLTLDESFQTYHDAIARVSDVVISNTDNTGIIITEGTNCIVSGNWIMDPGSSGIAACQQCCPRRSSYRSRGIIICKTNAVSCQSIYSRCLDFCRPIATEVVITLIIDKNENDIWTICVCRNSSLRI